MPGAQPLQAHGQRGDDREHQCDRRSDPPRQRLERKLDAMRSEGAVSLGLIASGAPHYIESFPSVARAGL